MKIVITGGHFSPAFSIISRLKSKNEILVIGRKYAFEGEKNETFEYKLCKDNDIPFININAGRLQRKLTFLTVPALFRFPKGIYSSLKILRKNNPEVVVTFGGYVGLSVSLAAKILGIPVILHEQTLKAGLSSRIISKYSKVVLVSFDSSKVYFKNCNTILTGNPIRGEFFAEVPDSLKVKTPSIYITGGSTGSHFINSIILEILNDLSNDYQIFHQTGNSQQFNDYEKLKANRSENYIVKEFFTPVEVHELLNKVDLVISRAGINTISELIASSSISLLIPLPTGQQNEQLENSKYLKSLGIGDYILQDDATSLNLLSKIHAMIKEKSKYIANSKKAQKTIIPDAVEKIIEQIYKYGQRGSGTRKTE